MFKERDLEEYLMSKEAFLEATGDECLINDENVILTHINQVNLGVYGIADIVTKFEEHGITKYCVTELKISSLSIDNVNQLCRYMAFFRKLGLKVCGYLFATDIESFFKRNDHVYLLSLVDDIYFIECYYDFHDGASFNIIDPRDYFYSNQNKEECKSLLIKALEDSKDE